MPLLPDSLHDDLVHNSPSVPHSSTSPDIPSDSDAEVDQLDSDSDDHPSAASSDRTDAVRPPGCSLLPSVRLENILQADGMSYFLPTHLCSSPPGVTGNLVLSKEALFILSVATEEFIKRMSRTGHIHATAQRRNVVEYVDMAASTQQYQEFMFLKDTIPTPISLADAIQLRHQKEKAMLEDDPALAVNPSPPTLFPLPNGTPKPKGKGRGATNGHGKLNGEASVSWRSEKHYKAINEMLPTPPWPGNIGRNGSAPVSSPGNVAPFVNGDISALPPMPHPMLVSQEPYDGHPGQFPPHAIYYPQPNIVPDRPEEAWLRGPGLVDPDHLAQTIYAKDRHGA